MASIAYTAGFYYVPRIDKKVVEQYKDDVMVLSGNLYGEILIRYLTLRKTRPKKHYYGGKTFLAMTSWS